MAIHLNKPYKIIQPKQKKYEAHYLIPADKSLVVPLKVLGEEVSCDVRWENDNGELKAIHNIVFVNQNLIPLNPVIDEKLYELWQHYYNREKDQ
jgi:hypothetical protein